MSAEVSTELNAPEVAPTPPPEKPQVIEEIGGNTMSAPSEEEIPRTHQETQIGATFDSAAVGVDVQLGFVGHTSDSQAHGVTYDSAADEENIRLAMHFGAQFNSYFKVTII